MARAAAKKTAKAKPAPVEEPEELLEDVEEDFEEVEEGDVEEAPAKKKAKGNGRPSVAFGIRHVCDILTKDLGKEVTPRELRTLARRLAKDASGRIDREIVPGNRDMYSWSGPEDPEVVALIAAYKGGEAEIEKKAKLEALKAAKADKPAVPAKKTAKKTTTAKKKAAPVVEEDDDEELDFDEDE